MPSIWRRAAVYLGLVDDEEYEEYEPYDDTAPAVRRTPVSTGAVATEPEPTSGSIRTLPREPESAVTVQPRAVSPVSPVRPIAPLQSAKVHVVAPDGFPDAKEIG